MAERYTIGDAADRLGKERKTLERWIERAGITTLKDTHDGRRRWITHQQLDQLAREHKVTLRPERVIQPQPATPDNTQQLRALTQQLRRQATELTTLREQVQALTERVQTLEARPAAIASVTRQDAQQITSPAQPPALSIQSAAPTPAPAQHVVRAVPKPAQDGEITRYQAIGFLTQHGAAYSDVNIWRTFPKERGEVLRYARERGQRLRQCEDENCVCREMLD